MIDKTFRILLPPEEQDKALFLINTSYIAVIDQGLADSLCRNQLISYFTHKSAWKPIAEFEAIEKIVTANKIHYYYFDEAKQNYLDLSDWVTLNKTAEIDKEFFSFFFAFRLSKKDLSRVIDFLAFTLHFHFEGNLDEFSFFIGYELIPLFHDLIGKDRLNILNAVFEDSNRKNTNKFKDSNSSKQLHLTHSGEQLLPFLIENYKDEEPRVVCNLVFALIELGLMEKRILNNKSKLHRALKSIFGNIGTLSGLNTSLNNHFKNENDPARKSEIAKIKGRILKFLKEMQ